MFIRYKKFGKQEYAYEVKSIWDSKSKKPKQKTKYLGVVVDKKKKIFERRLQLKKPEKLILDFGDGFILHEFFNQSGLTDLLKKMFSEDLDFIQSLISYRLCYPSAMRFSSIWYEGNYARIRYPKGVLSSQRISDYFKFLGDGRLQRDFFYKYIKKFTKSKKGIIIDATSLPNQIHMPLSAWGRSGEDIDKQIRFLLVVDKDEEMPLFFRYVPGNIVDVSTLSNTIEELKKAGINKSYIFLDAGYFSEDNIKELYKEELQFLTRLPSIRILYKELIKTEVPRLEKVENITRYGERTLFIKQKKVRLFGKEIYAHIVLDPKRKGREINKLGLHAADEKNMQKKELEYELMTRGIMILISSFKIKKEEVVPAYYVRQTAEKMFGFSKDDLKILPLRVHSEETLRGFLFMQFLSLIAFVKMKKLLGKEYTVEEALLIMRNLKCKVYDDEIIINELTKKQKEVAEKLKILMPKKLGI